MTSKPLVGAVIGVGYLGTFHAQKYRHLCQNQFKEQISFLGVCDSQMEQTQKVASDLGVLGFSNPKELIGKVDLVTIATTTSSHYDIAKLFLDNRVHVNVEKPMAVTSSEANELISLAKSKNLILCVGHSERFNPTFQALRGHIRFARHFDLQRHSSYKSRGTDVSVVHDLMIHDIDLALSLDQSHCEVSYAQGGKFISSTLDWAQACLRFSSGTTAWISVSRMAASASRLLKVVEKDCCHEVNFQTGEWSILSPIQRESKSEGGISAPLGTGLAVEVRSGGKGDNLLSETEAFFKAVLQQSPPMVTGEDGCRALRIVEQVVSFINKRCCYD